MTTTKFRKYNKFIAFYFLFNIFFKPRTGIPRIRRSHCISLPFFWLPHREPSALRCSKISCLWSSKRTYRRRVPFNNFDALWMQFPASWDPQFNGTRFILYGYIKPARYIAGEHARTDTVRRQQPPLKPESQNHSKMPEPKQYPVEMRH